MLIKKTSSIAEIEEGIHYFLLQKEGNFTFESAYNDFIKLCEYGIDKDMVKNALIECLEYLLDDGLIEYYNEFYHSTLTENLDQSI